MDLTIIFSKTPKAARAPLPWVGGLSASFKQVLSHVDGKHNVEQILPKCGKISSVEIFKILQKLEEDGYIKRTASHQIEPEWLNDTSGFGISANNNYSIVVEEIDPSELNVDEEIFRLPAEPMQAALQETVPQATQNQKTSHDQKTRNSIEAAPELQFDMQAPKPEQVNEPLTPSTDSNEQDKAPATDTEPDIATQVSAPQVSETAEQAKRIASVWAKARHKAESTAREQAEAAEKLKLQESLWQLETQLATQAEMTEKTQPEEALRIKAEAQRQAEAEAAERRAQEELAVHAQREAETQARLEAERIERERIQALAGAKAEEEARLKTEAERQAKAEVEEQARVERERMAQAAAAEKKLRGAERQARAQKKAEQALEQKAQAEAEKAARKAEKLLAKQEKAAQSRLKAEEKLRAKALRNFTRPRLKDSKLFKPLLASLLIAPVLAVAIMHVVNLTVLVAPVEQFASQTLGEAVQVEEVRASLFPRPHLILSNVSVGSQQALKISNVNITAGISMLFSDVKNVASIEIHTAVLTPAALARQAQWLTHAAKTRKLNIGQIVLKQVSLRVAEITVDSFNGKVTLTPDRTLRQFTLINTHGNLTITLLPAEGGASLTLTASDWSPPLLSALALDEVSAKAEVNQSRIRFSHIEAKAFGGSIRAQGDVNWSGNPSTSGKVELTKMTLPRLLAAYNSAASIDGTLNVNAVFTGNAPTLSALPARVEANANVDVRNGKINGLALSNALVSGPAAKPPVNANLTRFDTLSAQLQISNGHYQYQQCSLVTKQLNAQGNFNVAADNTLSGKLSAALVSTSQRRQANFTLHGNVADITLK